MFIKNGELIEYIDYMKYFGKHFDNHHLTIYSLSVIVYIYFFNHNNKNNVFFFDNNIYRKYN